MCDPKRPLCPCYRGTGHLTHVIRICPSVRRSDTAVHTSLHSCPEQVRLRVRSRTVRTSSTASSRNSFTLRAVLSGRLCSAAPPGPAWARPGAVFESSRHSRRMIGPRACSSAAAARRTSSSFTLYSPWMMRARSGAKVQRGRDLEASMAGAQVGSGQSRLAVPVASGAHLSSRPSVETRLSTTAQEPGARRSSKRAKGKAVCAYFTVQQLCPPPFLSLSRWCPGRAAACGAAVRIAQRPTTAALLASSNPLTHLYTRHFQPERKPERYTLTA